MVRDVGRVKVWWGGGEGEGVVRDVGRLKVGWGGGEGKGTGCAIQNKQIVIVLSQNLRRKNINSR